MDLQIESARFRPINGLFLEEMEYMTGCLINALFHSDGKVTRSVTNKYKRLHVSRKEWIFDSFDLNSKSSFLSRFKHAFDSIYLGGATSLRLLPFFESFLIFLHSTDSVCRDVSHICLKARHGNVLP